MLFNKSLKLAMMKKLLFSALFCLVAGLIIAQTQPLPDEKLPLDPKVKYGKLDNGMTYYVLHNEEPKDRASFYFVQNVGAILENDQQNGLAHFLEHMAFNGTKNYPDKGILDYLESYGVSFGRNINAYTNLDETVYNLSNVPVGNNNLIDSTLLVLHDWSNYLLLTTDEINKERGVIREEWRTRHTGQMRVALESRKLYFQGSKYAKRDIIGDLDVINNFDPKVLRDFYHDYYRTDLQAVVVVGDINADSIVGKIKEMFSPIPAVENPKPREYFDVPGNKEPIVGIVTDPEARNIQFSLIIKHKATPFDEKNMKYYREGVMENLYSNMIGMRYYELVQTGNPPFIGAYAQYVNMVRKMDAYMVDARLKEDGILSGIEAALTENERVLRYGFTATELERAKVALLSSYEKKYKERNKLNNDQLVGELQDNFLTNEPMPGIEYEYNLVQKLLPEIKLDEINSLAKQWNTDDNIVMVLSGPEKEGLVYPDKNQLLDVLKKVKQADIKPYVDKVMDKPLVSSKPEPGKIVSEKKLEDFDAVEWKFDNGAKVIIKNTDFKDNEINLQVYSDGGSSLYGVKDLPSIQMLGEFMNYFGIGDFDAVSLQKMLTGKVVNVSPYVSELYEGFSGSSSIADFETMLQLLYLYFENPRFDEDAFNALKARYLAYVANMDADVDKAFGDSVSMITTDYNKRTILFNTKMIEALDFATMQKIYKERFADPGDFTYVFVGNIKAEEAKPLIEKYIGGIKSVNRNEEWVDTKVDYPDKDTYKAFKKEMKTPKTTIYINMHGEGMDFNFKNRIYLNTVSELLDKRYTDVIREEEGGTYGVQVGGSISHFPKVEYQLSLNFDTDPEKADKLKGIVYDEIHKLCNDSVKADDLEEAKQNMIKVHEESLRKNGYWMSIFMRYYKDNEDIMVPGKFDSIVNSIDASTIQEFAKKYFTSPGKIEIVMSPEMK